MNLVKFLVIFMIILVVRASDAEHNTLENITQTEIDILRRLSSRINQPISLNGSNVSTECRTASKHFLNGLEKFEFWALQMHDSKAKLPSGILRGNIHQYGDFDQCLSAVSSVGDFSGKYCLANIQLTVPDDLKFLKHVKANFVVEELFTSTFADPTYLVTRSSEIHWAVCVPSTCSATDTELYINELLKDVFESSGVKIDAEVSANQCHVHDSDWISKLDTSTIAVNFLLAAYVIFVIAATFYEKFSPANEKSKWIEAFSITKNVHEIFDTTPSSSEVPVLHGIRFINVICIFFVHKSMMINYFIYTNRDFVMNLIKSPISYPFRAAYIYTDTFLLFGGLLISYSLIGRMQKGVKIDYFKEIAGRYLRIMPPFAAIVFFATWTAPLLGSGPYWVVNTEEAGLCRSHLWRNLLLIHNWFGIENMCLPQTHHIGTDFTLFVVSILMVVYAFKHPWKGGSIIAGAGVAAILARFYVVYSHELTIFLTNESTIPTLIKSANLLYFIPPYRFTSVSMGIFLGYVLRNYKNVKWSWWQLTLGHVSAVLCIVITGTLMVVNQEYDRFNQSLFAAISSVTWSWVFAWLILASHFGEKTILIKALEWRPFKVTTNLAYGFYLVQFSVFYYYVGVSRAAAFGTVYRHMFDLNEFVTILAASLFLAVFVEFPFGNIKKLLFDSKRETIAQKNK